MTQWQNGEYMLPRPAPGARARPRALLSLDAELDAEPLVYCFF